MANHYDGSRMEGGTLVIPNFFEDELTPQERLLAAAKTAVACCWDDKEGGILYPSKLAKQDLRDAIAAVEAVPEGSGATRFVEYGDGLFVKWSGVDIHESGVKRIGGLWETRGHFERYKERERGR